MCRYILPLLADTITPVQQGIFATWGFVSNTKSYQSFKTKANDLDCKARDKDFGVKDHGHGQ